MTDRLEKLLNDATGNRHMIEALGIIIDEIDLKDERIAELKTKLDAVRKENAVLRWVIWQHCEMADTKIAQGCHRWGIPFKPTKKQELQAALNGEGK